MRDKLCHRHDSLDPGELWQAALRDVPVLLDQLRVIERDLAGR